jgi:hypothetical protein
LLAIASLFACGRGSSEPPEIAPDAEEGDTELVFKIARHEWEPSGSQILSATGLLHGKPVGFDVDLDPWCENPPGYVNMTTWDCKARLRSQGRPSDDLLQFMDKLYGTNLSPSRMAKDVEVEGFSPWENPGTFHDGRVSFLLLFPVTFEEGDSAQVWLEVDTAKGRIRLREKEPRLRRALITALSASE